MKYNELGTVHYKTVLDMQIEEITEKWLRLINLQNEAKFQRFISRLTDKQMQMLHAGVGHYHEFKR